MPSQTGLSPGGFSPNALLFFHRFPEAGRIWGFGNILAEWKSMFPPRPGGSGGFEENTWGAIIFLCLLTRLGFAQPVSPPRAEVSCFIRVMWRGLGK